VKGLLACGVAFHGANMGGGGIAGGKTHAVITTSTRSDLFEKEKRRKERSVAHSKKGGILIWGPEKLALNSEWGGTAEGGVVRAALV